MKWFKALEEEVTAHRKNGTFQIKKLPAGTKTIGSTFVLTKKYDSQGVLLKFKARWVAQGFGQIEGVHYNETFAPTLRKQVFRMMLAVAVQYDLELNQMDVHTAFLIPKLPEKEEIFMRLPPNSASYLHKCGIMMKAGEALLLKKCIYGLKQASNYWNSTLVEIRNGTAGFLKEDHARRANFHRNMGRRSFNGGQ